MTTQRSKRLASVDFLRGLAISLMIVANNPGQLHISYDFLHHASWDGFTLADGIFPMFLFLVGVSVALAVNRDAVRSGAKAGFWGKVLKRTAVLIALGLVENAAIHMTVDELRFPGVLQRIAVVYLATVWLHVRLGDRGILATIGAVLAGYWLLLAFTPVPGLGVPSLGSQTNLEGWLDRLVFGEHIWKNGTEWDPEGILSTFPAIALGLIGLEAGKWLRRGGQAIAKAAAIGLVLAGLGILWNPWFPINKSLCSSSFVLLVGGSGIALAAFTHWYLDVRGLGRVWSKPWIVMGSNALALYITASLAASTLRNIRWTDAATGEAVSLQAYLYGLLFGSWESGPAASLAWGVAFLLPILGLAWALYAKRIFIKA